MKLQNKTSISFIFKQSNTINNTCSFLVINFNESAENSRCFKKRIVWLSSSLLTLYQSNVVSSQLQGNCTILSKVQFSCKFSKKQFIRCPLNLGVGTVCGSQLFKKFRYKSARWRRGRRSRLWWDKWWAGQNRYGLLN